MDLRYEDIVELEGWNGNRGTSVFECMYDAYYYIQKSSCDADLRRLSAWLDIQKNDGTLSWRIERAR